MLTDRKEEVVAIFACVSNYQPFVNVSDKKKNDLAQQIEKSIYEHAIEKARERHIRAAWSEDEFVIIYSNISYNVKVNLDVKSPVNADHADHIKTYLISRLYNYVTTDGQHPESIAPETLGGASPTTLNPLINQVYLEEIALRQQQGIAMKYSKMYKCGKCYKSKARVREIQSASSDEGTTLFITCINCGNRWRQYS